MVVASYIWWNLTLHLSSHPEVRTGKPHVCEEEPLEIMLHNCGTHSPFLFVTPSLLQLFKLKKYLLAVAVDIFNTI